MLIKDFKLTEVDSSKTPVDRRMGCEAVHSTVESKLTKGTMDIDLPAEVGPTEETVEALMEYLVGPLLPLKHSDVAMDTPSESKQKSVAKQVHAAAVLYNYYHLKHHREIEFLNFDQFCNLAIMFKPSILHHMKYMTQANRPTINDPENQLSLTEKAIMDACTISETLLDAGVNIVNTIKEWPITKVAVLLIDSKKENCFLKFNDGVWSVIEKDLYIGGKKGKKRKYDEEGEDGLQQLAFSAIKEAAGIMNDELMVLEGHVVYSLSQAKTATRFYIVQSSQSINEDNLVPIQDAISSLQGPVVKKSEGSWVITPVVEYYYLLPYAEIISKCFSRVPDTLTDQVIKEGGESKRAYSGNFQVRSKLMGSPPHEEVIETEKSIDNKVEGMNGSCKVEPKDLLSEGNNNKGIEKPVICLEKVNKNTKLHTPLKVYHHEKRTTPTNSVSIKDDLKNLKNMSITEIKNEKRVDGEKPSCIVSHHDDKTLAVDHVLTSTQQEVEDFQSIVDAKRSELSEAALRALLKKKQKLSNQQRNIKDELTLCDKKIQAILHGGIGGCLGLKLDAIIDCCNEICQQDNMQPQDHTNVNVGKSLPLVGKSLSEAQLTLRKACQELDDICLLNNWILPTYNTSHSEGGFVGNVTVKGTDFECSGVSGVQQSIHEAKNSAATHVITKLQQMALNHTTSLL